jgi:hypothetical protein
MDAATLYIVMTLANGEQKTSTVGEPTWQACWAHADKLRDLKRADPQAPIFPIAASYTMLASG